MGHRPAPREPAGLLLVLAELDGGDELHADGVARGGPGRCLSELVPLAVVTCGADGAIAHHQASGETVRAPAVPVEALDPTGAGDVFLAGLMVGTVAGWPLEHGLRLANLGAALSVRHFGGALAAPGWGDIAAWWNESGSKDPTLIDNYALPRHDPPRRRRPRGLQGDRHPGIPFLDRRSEPSPSPASDEAPARSPKDQWRERMRTA